MYSCTYVHRLRTKLRILNKESLSIDATVSVNLLNVFASMTFDLSVPYAFLSRIGTLHFFSLNFSFAICWLTMLAKLFYISRNVRYRGYYRKYECKSFAQFRAYYFDHSGYFHSPFLIFHTLNSNDVPRYSHIQALLGNDVHVRCSVYMNIMILWNMEYRLWW